MNMFPWLIGYEAAFYTDKGLSDNPYQYETVTYESWLDGFITGWEHVLRPTFRVLPDEKETKV